GSSPHQGQRSSAIVTSSPIRLRACLLTHGMAILRHFQAGDSGIFMSNNQTPATFQDLILALQQYWAEQGCVIIQPLDMEVGAGTFHPATFLRAIGPEIWNSAYVQPSRRPTDGRYGENPNLLQHYYQFQVVLKPSPDNIQDLDRKSTRLNSSHVKISYA